MNNRLLLFFDKWLLPALLTAAVWCCPQGVSAQSDDNQFQIVGHKIQDVSKTTPARLLLYVKAIENGAAKPLNRDALRFSLAFDGRTEQIVVDTVAHQIVEQDLSATTSRDSLNVLFLVGAGRTLPDEALRQRAALIGRIQGELEAGGGIRYYLGSYGNLAPRPEKIDSPTMLTVRLTELESRPDTCAELHRALVEATRFTRKNKGKWVIFILSDGHNKDNAAEFATQIPYTRDDVVKRFMPALSVGAFVIPIGIGANPDTDFFRDIVRATGNSADTFAVNTIPTGLRRLLGRRVDIRYNNIVSLYLGDRPIFRGEKRIYEGKWMGGPIGHKDSRYTLSEGTPSNPKNPSKALTGLDWLFNGLAGLGIVGGALGLIATALPFLSRRNFYKKYVRRYHKEPGVTKFDPVTRDELTEGEWVVTKCSRLTTTLASWEFSKNKCPNYPRCLDNMVDRCDGHGAPSGNEKLLSGNRPLNWVWFGMVGGLIAWTLFALLKNFGAGAYNTLLLHFSGVGGLNDQTIANLADDTLLGAAFGAGICFTLSWAEERSQTRNLSWWRIALRTFLGALLSLLVFFFGFYLQNQGIIAHLGLSGLVTWLLFGLVIGSVLSVESSVGLGRGLLGGLLAALFAYGLYALFNAMGNTDFGLAKLFSFILLGGVLGYTLVSVITRLEDFELEYVSPELFRQINPISKWLRRGIDISVGRESGNYVYVKWDDEAVQPVHARLYYDKGAVFIEPLAETLVNGKILPLNTGTPLRNNDLIQYGRTSITRMRYREKRRDGTS